MRWQLLTIQSRGQRFLPERAMALEFGECLKLCVWGLAHAVETGHLLNRSGYRIANWFRAATHSLTHLPLLSKLRMAR